MSLIEVSNGIEDTALEVARKFNDAVGATGVVAIVRADLRNVQEDVTEIKGDVKAIRSTMDRWGGAIALMSAGLSVAISLMVAALKWHP